jgi:hypothetical protein
MMGLPATMQAGGMRGWLDVLEQKQETLCAGAGSYCAGFIFLCDGFFERAGPRTKAQAATTAARASTLQAEAHAHTNAYT